MPKMQIQSYFWQKKWSWALLIVVTLIVGFVAPMKSFILQWMIDAQTKSEAIQFLIIGILIIAVTFISESASRNIFSKLQCGAVEKFRNQCMKTILGRDIETYKTTSKSSDLSILTNDMKMLSDDFYTALYQILLYGAMLIFALFMYIYINPALLIFVAIAAIAPLILPRVLDNKLKNNRLSFSQRSEEYVKNSTEILNGFEVLYDFQAQNGFRIENNRVSKECAKSEFSFFRVMNYSITLSSLLSNLLFYIVLLIGMLLVFDDKISIGYMVAATNLSNFIIAPCQVLSQNYARIKASKKIREKIENLMIGKSVEDERKEPLTYVKKVEMENVNFQYEENQKLIDNVNFRVSANEKIAIIGQSGCGKSTLAKLLYGYLNHYTGMIKFNETDVKNIDIQTLHQYVGYSSQSSYIFHDTIKNNICLYTDFSDDEVYRILNVVGLSEEISLLENGLDTIIDENIKNLSGGQLQRIALARVLIRKFDMLILDEVTSSLDPEMTESIMKYVLGLKGIVLVITHDVFGRYMMNFDKVYEMVKGKLKGKKDEQFNVKRV